MQASDLPRFVVDTHALYWFQKEASRLSAAADAVFRFAATGSAQIIVPAIVVAEYYYLTQKAGLELVSEVSAPLSAAKLCDDRRNNT